MRIHLETPLQFRDSVYRILHCGIYFLDYRISIWISKIEFKNSIYSIEIILIKNVTLKKAHIVQRFFLLTFSVKS